MKLTMMILFLFCSIVASSRVQSSEAVNAKEELVQAFSDAYTDSITGITEDERLQMQLSLYSKLMGILDEKVVSPDFIELYLLSLQKSPFVETSGADSMINAPVIAKEDFLSSLRMLDIYKAEVEREGTFLRTDDSLADLRRLVIEENLHHVQKYNSHIQNWLARRSRDDQNYVTSFVGILIDELGLRGNRIDLNEAERKLLLEQRIDSDVRMTILNDLLSVYYRRIAIEGASSALNNPDMIFRLSISQGRKKEASLSEMDYLSTYLEETDRLLDQASRSDGSVSPLIVNFLSLQADGLWMVQTGPFQELIQEEKGHEQHSTP